MSSTQSRPDFNDWLEAWLSGYNAARDGVGIHDFIRVAREQFEVSGSQLARKVAEGEMTEAAARALLGEHLR
jgi:hypothetical protein